MSHRLIAGIVLAAYAGLLVAVTPTTAAGWRKPRRACSTCPTCPPAYEIITTPSETDMQAPADPDAEIDPEADVAPVPPVADVDTSLFDQALVGQYDVASASNLNAPNMIGDFFGGCGLSFALGGPDQDFIFGDNGFDDVIVGLGPNAMTENVCLSPGTGGGVGRIKLAEDTSILPRDRVYFGYQFFDSVPLAGMGTDVNRFVPGFEKTFFGGLTSVEVRIPFAATVDSDQNLAALGTNNVELGNVTLFFKALLYTTDTLAIGAGLTVTTPTADDLVVTDATGLTRLKIENEGTHLAPYLGVIFAPGRFFTQLYFQYDVDATGRSAFLPNDNSELEEFGQFTDTTVVFLDWSAGFWLYRDETQSGFITGIAPVFEVHYNQALGDGDFITNNVDVITDTNDDFSIVNLTFGTHIAIGQRSVLTLATVLPVTEQPDRQSDYEFQVIFNHFFGQANYFRNVPAF